MILTIHRRLLNEKLKALFKKIKPGIVLDAGGANSLYKKIIPYTKYLVLELHEEYIKAKNNSFDTLIATELLEHTEDPKKVVSEFKRVLKKGGNCIISVPFMFPIHEDKFMTDYWRFTESGLKELFKEFSKVDVFPIGSTSTTIMNVIFSSFQFLNRLSPIAYKIKFGKNPSGFVVLAKK